MKLRDADVELAAGRTVSEGDAKLEVTRLSGEPRMVAAVTEPAGQDRVLS